MTGERSGPSWDPGEPSLCGSHPQKAEAEDPSVTPSHSFTWLFVHSFIHSFIQKTFTRSLGDSHHVCC